MQEFNIAVIPGDGIGQEVTPECVRVLDVVGEVTTSFRFSYEYFPWGCEYYLENGKMMDEDGLDRLRPFAAILFGAAGYPGKVPDRISLRELRLRICQGFDQYVCMRPSIILPGISSPLGNKKPGDIDIMVIRENTEGEYTGAGGRCHAGLPIDVAVETSVFTRTGVERIIRYAFEVARKRPRKHLISSSKSNAQQHIFSFWDDCFDAIAREYPDVRTERVLVDALCARFILKPETVDTVVASNLHADILTDIGGAISGSLGVAASTNINAERIYPSMFESVHGSAIDIFGKGIANPIGQIWSGALMLDHLGFTAEHDLIFEAIKAVTGEGRYLTPDLGGSATTREVTDAIIARIRKP
ncbi:MAG: tartrate dehydrogenase [Planctomycetes bacterium]|nr:tartrate dehydrogenase [Planctomycetota bacterium]